jgi:hypothetical protein
MQEKKNQQKEWKKKSKNANEIKTEACLIEAKKTKVGKDRNRVRKKCKIQREIRRIEKGRLT